MNFNELLSFAFQKQASDLHLSSNMPPILRIDGKLERIGSIPLEHSLIDSFVKQLLSPPQKAHLLRHKFVDFALSTLKHQRCRINIFLHQQGLGIAIRLIADTVPQLEAYANFTTLKRLLEQAQGLLLICGASGSGKSTTLNSMVDYLNHHHRKHIIMLEDPIEYAHTSALAFIHQRELGTHFHNFSAGIKASLREDPNTIIIGELREQKALRYALTAAETGHLVIATLHANGAAKALDRIIQAFPPDEQNLVRLMLSESLLGIIYQTLICRREGPGRFPIQELLLASPAIKNLIREHKIPQIEASMEISQDLGMQTLAQALKKVGL